MPEQQAISLAGRPPAAPPAPQSAPVIAANHIFAWRAIVRSLATTPKDKLIGAVRLLHGQTFKQMEAALGYPENYCHKVCSIDGHSNKCRAAMAGYVFCETEDIWTPQVKESNSITG